MKSRRAFIGGLGASFLGVSHVSAQPLGLTAPPQAAANGFTNLVFEDDFTGAPDIGFGTTGHKWNAGLWWEPIPSPMAFVQQGSKLTLNAGNLPDLNLCTQCHVINPAAQGGTQFLGGYFEARMRCHDWSAFWLLCWDRPWVWGGNGKILASDPTTWTNEIDIVETDPGFPDSLWCTLHENSSGNVVPDAQNYPAQFKCNTPIINNWHVYGLLWTQGFLTWFVDEIPVLALPPYPSTWQPVQLIFSAAPGGVGGSPSTTNPPTTEIDWVRVWH